jgi:hypothetical protein
LRVTRFPTSMLWYPPPLSCTWLFGDCKGPRILCCISVFNYSLLERVGTSSFTHGPLVVYRQTVLWFEATVPTIPSV